MDEQLKQSLLDLSRSKLIGDITKELSDNLSKLTTKTPKEEAKKIFKKCDEDVARLIDRLNQLKSNYGI